MKLFISVTMVIFLYSGQSFAGEKPKKTPGVTYTDPCENFHTTGLKLEHVAPFIDKFKTHLIKNNIAGIAKQVSYPIRFNSRKLNKVIKDEKSFIAEFPKFINKKWKGHVIKSSKKGSVCNSDGVGLFRGSVWITAPRYHTKPNVIKIIAINVY